MNIKLSHHRVILSEKPADGGKIFVWIQPHGPFKSDGMEVRTESRTRVYALPADLKLKKIRKIFYMPPEMASSIPLAVGRERTWWDRVRMIVGSLWKKGRRAWITITTWARTNSR